MDLVCHVSHTVSQSVSHTLRGGDEHNGFSVSHISPVSQSVSQSHFKGGANGMDLVCHIRPLLVSQSHFEGGGTNTNTDRD